MINYSVVENWCDSGPCGTNDNEKLEPNKNVYKSNENNDDGIKISKYIKIGKYIIGTKFTVLNQKFAGKIPGGLVTKTPTPGYEMVRVGGSQGVSPGFAPQNQMNQLGQFGGAAPYGFPPNLASLAGFNPAAFLQQSKFLIERELE